jgi:hypothetical protein
LGSPAEVEEALKHRWQIINLWRPIGHDAFDWPLTFCDFRTVDKEKDLMPVALIYPAPLPEGDTFSVHYDAKQRWCYLRGMRPDEAVLIKWYVSLNISNRRYACAHVVFLVLILVKMEVLHCTLPTPRLTIRLLPLMLPSESLLNFAPWSFMTTEGFLISITKAT